MIENEEQAHKQVERLQGLRALEKNPVWKEVQAKLDKALRDAAEGISARGKTPEQRAEWVELYHFAKETAGWLEKETVGTDAHLREWLKTQAEVDMRMLDAMDERSRS
jgi:hypothetical protein